MIHSCSSGLLWEMLQTYEKTYDRMDFQYGLFKHFVPKKLTNLKLLLIVL